MITHSYVFLHHNSKHNNKRIIDICAPYYANIIMQVIVLIMQILLCDNSAHIMNINMQIVICVVCALCVCLQNCVRFVYDVYTMCVRFVVRCVYV